MMKQPVSMTMPEPTDLRTMAYTRWAALLANISPTVVAKVADIVSERKAGLAAQFYDAMLADNEAASFLSHDIVNNQLHASMQKWLQELFQNTDLAQITAAIAHQRSIGEVHARIHLPLHLVARGITILRQGIYVGLAASDMDRADLIQAADYVTTLTALALELMSAAFMRSTERAVRSEEAYRLFSLGQDIHVERERQRAMLMEWAHMAFSTLYRSPGHALLSLGKSEFGLWFHHKGQIMFEGSNEVNHLNASISRIDGALLPDLIRSIDEGDSDITRTLMADLDSEIVTIRFHLTTLFDRHVEIENGRDVLTRLLNRRFVPVVLSREIEFINKNHGKGFAVLLIDLDHFKRLNDEHGHDVGDLALQHAAGIISGCIRAGDFLFRYGGEEFLLVLAEVDQTIALRIAEFIRKRLESNPISVNKEKKLTITASIGLAIYDAHPDYQYLISAADKALYEAKRLGRNCVHAAAQVAAVPGEAPDLLPFTQ